jgi:hypothetical protein
MRQLQAVAAVLPDVPAPALPGPVRAGVKQPVERRVQAQFLPETAEHQVGAEMPQGPGLQAPCLIALDHPNLVSEAAQGFQRDLHAVACGEFVAAAQRGQDPLHGAFALLVVLHDL